MRKVQLQDGYKSQILASGVIKSQDVGQSWHKKPQLAATRRGPGRELAGPRAYSQHTHMHRAKSTTRIQPNMIRTPKNELADLAPKMRSSQDPSGFSLVAVRRSLNRGAMDVQELNSGNLAGASNALRQLEAQNIRTSLAQNSKRETEMTLLSSVKQPKLTTETQKSIIDNYVAPGISQRDVDYLFDSTQDLHTKKSKEVQNDLRVEQKGKERASRGAREIIILHKGWGRIGTTPLVPLKAQVGDRIVDGRNSQKPAAEGRAMWSKNRARAFARANVSAVGSSRLSLGLEGYSKACSTQLTARGGDSSISRNLGPAYSVRKTRDSGYLKPTAQPQGRITTAERRRSSGSQAQEAATRYQQARTFNPYCSASASQFSHGRELVFQNQPSQAAQSLNQSSLLRLGKSSSMCNILIKELASQPYSLSIATSDHGQRGQQTVPNEHKMKESPNCYGGELSSRTGIAAEQANLPNLIPGLSRSSQPFFGEPRSCFRSGSKERNFIQSNIKSSFDSAIFTPSRELSQRYTNNPYEDGIDDAVLVVPAQNLKNLVEKRRKRRVKEDARRMWTAEYYKQVKGANLLSERYSQNQLDNLDSISMASASQDLRTAVDRGSGQSHQDHEAYRKSVLSKIDQFMDLDFEQYLVEKEQRVKAHVTLESLKGAKPYIKNEVFVTKLLNSCDAAGGQLFESFENQYVNEAQANEPPELHAQQLVKELGLRSEQALINYFVERLRQEEKREQYQKSKKSLRKEPQPQPHHMTAAKQTRLRHRHQSEEQSMQAGPRWPAHLRVSMAPRSPANSRPTSPVLSALIKRQQTREIVKRKLKQTHRQELRKRVAAYHDGLENDRRAVADQIQAQQTRERYIEDPSLAPDLLDLFEDNVSQMVAESEFYHHVQVATAIAKEREAVRAQAAELTAGLHGRAEHQREQQAKSIRQSAAEGIKDAFVGNKKAYLVNKFIANLKKKVMESKDTSLQLSNEAFVQEIMKKQGFLSQLRKAAPETEARANKHQRTDQKTGLLDQISQSQNLKQSVFGTGKGLDGQRAAGIIEGDIQLSMDLAQVIDGAEGGAGETGSPNGIEQETSLHLSPNWKDVNLEESIATERERDEDAVATMDGQHQTLGTRPKISPRAQGSSAVQPKRDVLQVSDEVMADFIKFSMGSNQQPLPLFSRIMRDGYLPLINYQINQGNLQSFALSLPRMIPEGLSKLYLVNNAINDQNLKRIIDSVAQKEGLRGFGIIQNSIGDRTCQSLSQELIPSAAFRSVKAFVLKDPAPEKAGPDGIMRMLRSLDASSSHLQRLNKLCLSHLGFNSSCVELLGQAVTKLRGLQHLDISANHIGSNALAQFLSDVHGKNGLRSLNIGCNSGASSTRTLEEVSPLEKSLSDFMHYSSTLVHLDMSCLGLTFGAYKYIARNGLRKSRTLLAVHISGMGLLDREMIEFRELLKVTKSLSQRSIEDLRLSLRYQVASVQRQEFAKLSGRKPAGGRQKIGEWVAKQAQNHKLQVQAAIKKPMLNTDEGEQIVYHRILGRPEILGSHRWVENVSKNCHVCQKQTYCLFIWNQKLSELSIAKNRDSVDPTYFYHHSAREPILPRGYCHPILYVAGEVHQMLPLSEFLERLSDTQAKVRACDNELEHEKFQFMEEKINEDSKWLDPTYWSLQKEISAKLSKSEAERNDGLDHQDCTSQAVGSQSKLVGWHQKLAKLLPARCYQPVDLARYGQMIEDNYQEEPMAAQGRHQRITENLESSSTSLQAIANDTWLCAVYLPESIALRSLDFAVKHPSLKGVDFMTQQVVPRAKHLSVNTVNIAQKSIKKVSEIRHFHKPSSAFAKWAPATDAVMLKAFTTDMELTKIPKFVKDDDDRQKTLAVLKQHYTALKNQFINQIANPKSYPVIDWLDFVDACTAWGIIDKNLTSTDVDRIFIATNFEEEDLEENDDSSLCRFEFIEIIARMAKTKYYEKGLRKTVHEACTALLEKYILPNTIEKMEWQEFRDTELWTLEVDDLLKANLAGIEALYKKFATLGKSKSKAFQKDDALSLLAAAATQAQIAGDLGSLAPTNTPPNQKTVVCAYSLSKMAIGDEMKDFDSYNKMQLVEFYEFLGRWARLLFATQSPSLPANLETLLSLLLPLASCEFTPAKTADDVPSDSDYDDDIVDEVIQAKKSAAICKNKLPCRCAQHARVFEMRE